jgi:phosphohistidine phosphatase
VKTLNLLRHTKSSWSEPSLADHDRPLTKRGRRAAAAMGRHLVAANIVPDLVLCSTALRTRQTLDLILPAIKPPKIILDRQLYEASQRRLLDYLRDLPDGADSVLLIGHNPGLHTLALILAQPDTAAKLPPRLAKFPTGALASFRLAGRWQKLRPHGAEVTGFVTPAKIDAAGKPA